MTHRVSDVFGDRPPDDLRRRADGDREVEEGPEVLRGCHAGDIETGNARLEAFVKDGKTVLHSQPAEDVATGQERYPGNIHLVSGRQNDLIDGQRLAVFQPNG